MSEEEFKKGIESIKKVSMTPAEKEHILLSLLKEVELAHLKEVKVSSAYNVFDILNWSRAYSYGASFALLFIIVGTSTSFAAERANPGDVLYPIKVSVNEPIRGALIKDNIAKIEWEGEKLDRRLSEVEALADGGDIDERKVEQLEKNLDKNLRSFDTKINNVGTSTNEQKEKAKSFRDSVKNKIEAKIKEIKERREERGKDH